MLTGRPVYLWVKENRRMAKEAGDTVLITRCMYCKRKMGEQPGHGVSGESSSICPDCWAERFPGVPYPIEEVPEQETAIKIVHTMLTKTINDITAEQMNRIIRRISRMSRTERGIPKRVADTIADELGPQKALQYIDKALAAGQLKVREYDEMRAALLMPIPRQEIPIPTVRRMAAELLQGQEKLREDYRRLTGAGQQTFRKPVEALNEDVKRIRKAWGL